MALDTNVRRHEQGWKALDHLNKQARSSTSDTITSSDGTHSLHIDRGEIAAGLLSLARLAPRWSRMATRGRQERLCPRLHWGFCCRGPRCRTGHLHQPTSPTRNNALEFANMLGSPLAALLTESSAPRRLLVIDGADAVAEGRGEHLRYLIDAAHDADVGIVAVSATDQRKSSVMRSAARFGVDVVDVLVAELTDSQVDEVVAGFDGLSTLRRTHSRALLRRPVVIDLLVRSGISGIPLSDADAMRQVWEGLVRRNEQSDRGTPGARSTAMLRLADLHLLGGDPLGVVEAIDPTALEGLRHDGLLRRAVDDPFQVPPRIRPRWGPPVRSRASAAQRRSWRQT
ncbi:MAG: hypothetical protein IPN52_15145 [Micrococcales bacterium]|nr:hypothetical protein [Micrococcales bacterium]